jgi:dTDP-4-amino-4,6-dideoxygalactose transaminase
MSSVPFTDLAWQWSEIESEVGPSITELLRSGFYVSGRRVLEFERGFASSSGSHFGVGMNSGTSALHAGMSYYGFTKDDEIITTSHTFIASVSSILLAGATPVLVDVNRNGLMDTKSFLAAISPKTRGVLFVHLYGSCVDEELVQKAKELGLRIFEDASQSHLASFKSGLPVGHFGDFTAYSFYPGKNLGAVGEGGMLTTNNEDIYEYAKRFRNWGSSIKYEHLEFGLNYRMDELQAAVLSAKLKRLDQWTRERQEIAQVYNQALKSNGKVELVNSLSGRPVFHQYVIKVNDRDMAQAFFKENEIETSIHYPIPVHKQKALQGRFLRVESLHLTENLVERIISLPIFPGMKSWQIAKVADAILDCP